MNFNYSEDQLAIKDVADRMFRDLCGDEQIRALFKTAQPFHAELWAKLAGAGLLAATLPAELGGSDMGLLELSLVLEAQGRSVAPVPLLESVVACAMPIARFAPDELKRSLVPTLASGEAILVPVRPYDGLQDFTPLKATATSSGWELNGSSSLCLYAPVANGFLVQAKLNGSSHWVGYCAANTLGVRIVQQRASSGEIAGQIHFDQVKISAANTLAIADEAETLLEWQAQRVFVAMAAQQVGILREGMQRAASYTNERTQFGRSLSSFQAVAQQAADGYMAVEALQGIVWRALEDIDNDADTVALSARVAKFWLCESGHVAAHVFLHLHGGIGQDLDYPLHRYFIWAKKNEVILGSARQHSVALGKQIAANPELFYG